MTKRELAARLKVSTRTIERLKLPFMRVGGQNRYKMSEVQQFLRAGERAGNVVPLRARDGGGDAA